MAGKHSCSVLRSGTSNGGRPLNGVKDDPSYGDITRFLVRTGRRIDETTRYEKADVICNEQGKPLYIKVRAEITKTKDDGEIPLDEELAETVSTAQAKNPKQKFLFTNRFGRKVAPTAYIEHCLRPICRREGIKGNITPHCFRYYVVNKLLNAGVNPKDAMQITGHIDIGSFLSYLKSTKEGTQRALAATKIGGQ
ncbi:MAG: tyrosine-type recombinase/integrase [Candidatus Omnitrophica bacterium]|nr:tyrosine-type recombinase/integrase [Candidatus Omnitrophota bacterium]